MLGVSAGVMIAASFWSLLSPSIELCDELGLNSLLIPSIAFLTGGIFVLLSRKFLAKFTFKNVDDGNREKMKSGTLMMTAMTMHNIPEGMAVGVAFGSLLSGVSSATLASAWLIALGIGIQNFPEGAAVSFPLKSAGMSCKKSFFWGQLSGIVEPFACICGFFLATLIESMLPFLLAFSAGAMIIVTVCELIPEATEHNATFATCGFMIGFLVMMLLDLGLG